MLFHDWDAFLSCFRANRFDHQSVFGNQKIAENPSSLAAQKHFHLFVCFRIFFFFVSFTVYLEKRNSFVFQKCQQCLYIRRLQSKCYRRNQLKCVNRKLSHSKTILKILIDTFHEEISRKIYPDSCRKSRYFTCWNSQSARHHNFYAYTQGVRDRGAYPDIRVLYHAYIIVSKFRQDVYLSSKRAFGDKP